MTKQINPAIAANVRNNSMPTTTPSLHQRCQAWLQQLPPQLDLPFILQATALLLLADLPPGQLSHTLHTQADVLLPSALVFLLLHCSGNSQAALRQYGRFASLISALLMTALLMLSFILSCAILFPDMAGNAIGRMLSTVSIGSLIIAILAHLRSTHVQLHQPATSAARPETSQQHARPWLRYLSGYLRLVLLLATCKLLLALL